MKKIAPKEGIEKPALIKYGTVLIGGLFAFMGIFIILTSPQGSMGVIFIMLGAIVGIVPYAIYKYMFYARFRGVEDDFPRFLRDLAEDKKSGMTFPQALVARGETDYGRMNYEIKRAINQLSWGIPFTQALTAMGKRLKESRLIVRTFTIIDEAFNSGGDVTDVMDDLSSDIILLKEIEKERKSMMSQQIFVMYIISIIFLIIVIMLYKLLVPMVSLENLGGGGGLLSLGGGVKANYCEVASFMCSVCPILNFGSGSAGQLCYFESLFFFMAIIQGICSGIIAGVVGEGSATAGIKHSLILVTISISVFLIFG